MAVLTVRAMEGQALPSVQVEESFILYTSEDELLVSG